MQNNDVVLFADGGSRGNPGFAAAGWVIFPLAAVTWTAGETYGDALAHGAAYLGQATNNYAEYQGMLEGLEAVIGLQPKSVIVAMDSELAVKQMRGEYKVKHPNLRPLWGQAMAMVAKLKKDGVQVSFKHVPRALNAYADRLVNECLDAETGESKRW